MRGGGSTGLALVAHDVEKLDAMVIGHGVEVPNSLGLFGGLPGACAYHLLKRSNQGVGALLERYWNAARVMADETVEDLGAKPGGFRIGQGDVFCYTFQGGGGYGDPLLRPPARVLQDVRDGHVSAASAAALYGVAIAGEDIDQPATEARRRAIRQQRLGGKVPKKAAPEGRSDGSAEIRIGADRHFHCGCGTDLGPCRENWKPRAVGRKLAAADCGPHVRLHAELELREFCCPDCATLLEVEVLRKDEEPLWSMSLA
jgi:N-methylhydantoinase B